MIASRIKEQEAMRYASLGWRVIPLHTSISKGVCSCPRQHECGKNGKSAGKHPHIREWQHSASTDENVISDWWSESKWPDANVGVVMGPSSNLISIDCDDEKANQWLHEVLFKDYEHILQATPCFRSGGGSGHFHYLFQYTADLPNSENAHWNLRNQGINIDFKIGNGDQGTYCVFPPSNHHSGQTYDWIVDVTSQNDVLAFPLEVCARLNLQQAEGGWGESSLNGNEKLIALSAIQGLNPSRAEDHDSWVKIGMIMHSVNPEDQDLLIAWDRWSQLAPEKYQQGACAGRWQSFDRSRKGAATLGTLIYLARKDGWTPPDGMMRISSHSSGEEPDDPHRLARLCLQQIPDIRYWRSEFYLYESPAYRVAEDDEIKSACDRIIKADFDALYEWESGSHKGDKKQPKCRKVTRNLRANVLDVLQGLCLVKSDLDAPVWLKGKYPWPADRCILAKNGIVPADAPEEVIRPTSDLFAVNSLHFDYVPGAECPRWLAFLDQLWPHDSQSISSLQEIMGYLLVPETRMQKMFMLIGPKRSGKGTIGRIIQKLVGEKNVVSPTLSGISGTFGLQPLLNKTVAIIGDARLSRRTDSVPIVEELLGITGEDSKTVHRKYLGAVNVRLKTRFLLMSNELPSLDDASATLPSRLIFLQLKNSFYGKEDTGLGERLLNELPGILNWAIVGLKRLSTRGHFVQPQNSEFLLENMEKQSSPVGAFLSECCQLKADSRIPSPKLEAAYVAWCDEHRIKPLDSLTFAKGVHAAYGASVTKKQAREGGKKLYFWFGIDLACVS